MRDNQSMKFAGYMEDYPLIMHRFLPDHVMDELCNDSKGNDSGTVVNPYYKEKFKAWLETQNMPLCCYIIWWSW